MPSSLRLSQRRRLAHPASPVIALLHHRRYVESKVTCEGVDSSAIGGGGGGGACAARQEDVASFGECARCPCEPSAEMAFS
jgi:hypothetical protein